MNKFNIGDTVRFQGIECIIRSFAKHPTKKYTYELESLSKDMHLDSIWEININLIKKQFPEISNFILPKYEVLDNNNNHVENMNIIEINKLYKNLSLRDDINIFVIIDDKQERIESSNEKIKELLSNLNNILNEFI